MTNPRHALLLPSLLLAGACLAQLANLNPLPVALCHAAGNDPGNVPIQPQGGGDERGGGDVLFSEDFANGLAGNNGVGPWTVSGPNGNVWKRSTTGPRGAYSTIDQIIGAPATFANGFMAFWSDSVNCDWTNPTAPVVVAAPANLNGALVSPVLNLSASPAVKIEFNQRFRWCCSPTSPNVLEISTDGGATWPTSISATQGIGINQDPGTTSRSFIITDAIAANPANVRFRFQHNPNSSHYHWQIDDVRIIELYVNDLRMNDGYLSHTSNRFEFGNIPQSQLYPTMQVGGRVTNRGANTQTNVTVTTTVRNAANAVVFTGTGSVASIAPGATADIPGVATVPAGLAEGLYTATFVASSDQTEEFPTDNSYQRGFRVTNAIYGLDGIGNHPAGRQVLDAVGTSTFINGADGVIFMSYYQVRQPLTVYGVEVALASTTVAGGFITTAVRDTVPVIANPPNMAQTRVESAQPVDITAAHITAGRVRDIYPSPVTLPVNGYFASVTLNSNSGASHIRVLDDLTVTQLPAASLVYVSPQVGTNGNAFAIRLITSPSVGIGERERLTGVSIFPNPANGLLNVRTEFPGAYTIEVMDMTGRTVATALGNGSTTVDLSGRAQGVYMVRVTRDNASMVERIVLD